MSVLETKGLCKNYDSNNILSDIDLKLDKGEFIAVMGQSGCGKSTLLKILDDFLERFVK